MVPFPNAEVIQLIHHSFMLQYLRDTVVIGILDDMSLSALTALVLDTNLAIFHVLQRDPQFDADVYVLSTRAAAASLADSLKDEDNPGMQRCGEASRPRDFPGPVL